MTASGHIKTPIMELPIRVCCRAVSVVTSSRVTAGWFESATSRGRLRQDQPVSCLVFALFESVCSRRLKLVDFITDLTVKETVVRGSHQCCCVLSA